MIQTNCLRLLQTFAGLYWSIFFWSRKLMSAKHTVNARGSVVSLARRFQVDTFPCEGVIRLQIFRRRKLALVFRENPFSLNELIGYTDLTDFS